MLRELARPLLARRGRWLAFAAVILLVAVACGTEPGAPAAQSTTAAQSTARGPASGTASGIPRQTPGETPSSSRTTPLPHDSGDDTGGDAQGDAGRGGPGARTALRMAPAAAELAAARAADERMSPAQSAGQVIYATYDGTDAPVDLVAEYHLAGVIAMSTTSSRPSRSATSTTTSLPPTTGRGRCCSPSTKRAA